MSGYPTQFGGAPQYRNPDVTLPLPGAENIPVPIWEETDTVLNWGSNIAGTWSGPVQVANAAGAGLDYWQGGLYQQSWSTPIFDLRPDIRSGQGAIKNGVPMWRQGARLFVQLSDLQSGSASRLGGFRLVAREHGNTTFAIITARHHPEGATNSVVLTTTNVDIGAQVVMPAAQPASMILTVSPQGTATSGSGETPLRYWRFILVMEIRSTGSVAAGPVFTPTQPTALKLQAAVY